MTKGITHEEFLAKREAKRAAERKAADATHATGKPLTREQLLAKRAADREAAVATHATGKGLSPAEMAAKRAAERAAQALLPPEREPLPPDPPPGHPAHLGNGAGTGTGSVVNLSVIKETAGDFDTALDQARRALIAQGRVYRRDRVLVVPDGSQVAKTRYGDKAHLTIHQLDAVGVERQLVHCAHFIRLTKKGTARPTRPSLKLIRALLAYYGTAPMGLPALRGVMRSPFLRRDGTVCTATGYDAATGIYFDPGDERFPAMPTITPANAKGLAMEALRRLIAPLRGYRFDTSATHSDGTWNLEHDTGRAVLIASFLTVLAVSATRTRPGTLIDAPTYGSGKTMATELPVLMMIGDDPALISVPDKGSSDELDKQIDACLLAGRGYIILDNARGDLGRSSKIVSLLTASKTAVRIFHTQGDIDVDPPVLLISGNNAEANEDLGRRLLRCRIDTQHERPDEQAFDFDPREEVLLHRGQLAIDALTIMRAYVVAGSPAQNGRAYGSFEEWARLVRDALMWLGLPDIVPSNDEHRDDDADTAKLDALLEAWEAAHFDDDLDFATASLIETITPGADDSDFKRRATHRLYLACLDVAAKRLGGSSISPERLGRWLNKHKDRRRNGRFLARRLLDGRYLYSLGYTDRQQTLKLG